MRNVRDHERDMAIYHARKIEKRTFADIAKEFGITPERVRRVYRRTDWQLNGENSDAWRRDEEKLLRQKASRIED